MNQQKTLLEAKKTIWNLCETNNEYPLAKATSVPRHLSGTCDSCQYARKTTATSNSTEKQLSKVINKGHATNGEEVETIELFTDEEETKKIYRKRRSRAATAGDDV